MKNYDYIIIAIEHDYIKKQRNNKIKKYLNKDRIIFDLKNIFNKNQSDLRL